MVLEISVQENNCVTSRQFHATGEGHLGTKVAGVVDSNNPPIFFGDFPDPLFAVVRAGVVYKYYLVGDTKFSKCFPKSFIHYRYRPTVFVTSNYCADFFLSFHIIYIMLRY